MGMTCDTSTLFKFLCPTPRGVHESIRVGLVPNSRPSRQTRVENVLTHRRESRIGAIGFMPETQSVRLKPSTVENPAKIVDFGPSFVDRLGHYLSACPIRHLPKPLVSWDSQDSTVQGSSPHKSNHEVWCDALNVVVATIPSIMSRLTSPKLFLYSITSSGNVPLTWSYYPSM